MTTTTAMQASFTDHTLTISNTVCSRQWKLEDYRLCPSSFMVGNHEWLKQPGHGIGPATSPGPVIGNPELTIKDSTFSPVGHACTHITLTIPCTHGPVRFHCWIADETPLMSFQLEAPSGEHEQQGAIDQTPDEPTGVEVDPQDHQSADILPDIQEHWPLQQQHCTVAYCELMDRTDLNDDLCHWHQFRLGIAPHREVAGCLFAIEDQVDGHGIAVIKHHPLPHVRPVTGPADCRVTQKEVFFQGHGAGDRTSGYPWTIIAYDTAHGGRTTAIQQAQQAYRCYQVGRDGCALSNTWGDRNRDGALNETFINNEIELAGQLGIDVCQIDDGWQRGVTQNSVASQAHGGVWEGFYAANNEFWQHHQERLPHGLGPLVEKRDQAGIGLGLWFAPDSAHDFANWQRDVDEIVRLHRDYGVNWIKIDGVKSRTKIGEANLQRFFFAVLEQTNGAVTFDLDVTAEVRPGYLGRMESGPLFVENRYTDWMKYWPNATFANLWNLSSAIHPCRLRMEILNLERNQDKYGDDPLAPGRYDMAYVFASIMVASPLIWCELSGLSDAAKASLQDIIPVWKHYREELHTATVHPIGMEPNGSHISGFYCHNPDKGCAHMIVLREPLAPEHCRLTTPHHQDWSQAEIIFGDGQLQSDDDSVRVHIPNAASCLWQRITLPI